MHAATAAERATWDGVMRLVDPKITLASAASLLLGFSAAAREGPLAWGWLALTVVAIVLVEAAKNASGEVVDYDSGVDQAVAPEDRSPFSGGKRVIVDGLLSRRATAWLAAGFYALAAASGLWIALGRDRRVLWLGIAGFACAFFYHASPLRLSYRGLGELTVALAYGPLIAGGAYLVQRGTAPGVVPLVLSLALGALVAAFLVANEFPDARADASAGKRTLVVRLGRARATRLFGVTIGLAFAALALAPLLGAPRLVWWGLVGAPFGFAAWRRLANEGSNTRRVVMAQRWSLAAFLLMSAGSALGLVEG